MPTPITYNEWFFLALLDDNPLMKSPMLANQSFVIHNEGGDTF
jgi:hypothetical protein